ncbi:MAG: tetratricopeptide repeat protein [Pedosphaera sp.]|nr:tetratricopeptide repeat protein [Pedosphaera sp.]
MWRLPFMVFLLLLAVGPIRAADLSASFEQANKLYEEGKFAAAVDAYNTLLETGRASTAIYFNRGNAFFKLGQVGRAIASYRLAEQISPRDPDLQANLRFARTQARGGTQYRKDLWHRWLGALTLNEWTLLTAAAAWLLLGLLAIAQWRPELGRKMRNWLVTAGLTVFLLGISLVGALNNGYFTTTAIVITGEAEVRNGPLDESQTAFKVRDGVELNVLDRKDDWLEVVDPAQRSGWVRQSQMLIFEPGREHKSKL